MAAIDTDYDNDRLAFLFLKIETSTRGYYVLQFNSWNYGGGEIAYSDIAYTIKHEIDLTVFNDFRTYMI